MSDTTPKHTPEPWTIEHEVFIKNGGLFLAMGMSQHTGNAIAKANTERIVTCVNTLAGVTVSPGASVKALVEAAQLAITYIDTLWNGNGAVIAQRARDALAGFSIEEAQG